MAEVLGHDLLEHLHFILSHDFPLFDFHHFDPLAFLLLASLLLHSLNVVALLYAILNPLHLLSYHSLIDEL